nr:MAG TPA: hypothetical protein [Caudoviricetes sp.]
MFTSFQSAMADGGILQAYPLFYNLKGKCLWKTLSILFWRSL